jgi:membrane-associated protease RseP (regulator of RpoE activity)
VSEEGQDKRLEGAHETGADAPARYGLHLGLFLATCGTTFLSGSGFGSSFNAVNGFYFAGTIMTILFCHEMGHFLVAKRHGIAASLPFFIPLPPFISLGTLGAVIQMDSPIEDRNKLIDVGAAGPLAGLVVAIPLLIYGLSLSPLGVTPSGQGAMMEGNSILYLALKYLVHGMVLPTEAGLDVQLHPMAFAAWVGLLITMINLLPIGQLDGGHIACAALGDKHESFSRVLHWLLLLVGLSVVAWLTTRYVAGGLSLGAGLSSAFKAGMPWLVWAGLLLVMRRMSDGRYHPPVGQGRLTRGRTWLVIVMVIILILIFTPIPLREAVL